jgi:hypothetical protein
MKPLYNLFLLLLTGLVLTGLGSCKKFLNTTPSSFTSPLTYYSTDEELQTALNGVYNSLQPIYNGGIGYTLTATTDESTPRNTGVAPELEYTYVASDAIILSSWQNLYTGVSRANLLLANMGKVNNGVMDHTDTLILGQALFLRAYYYFLLVRGWGDVPLVLQPTASISNTSVARTASITVYQQIVGDMRKADTLLQTQSVTSLGYNGAVTRTAVEGILARVYLTWAGSPLNDVSQYANAQTYINKVINDGEHYLNTNYSQIFLNLMEDVEEIHESIWEVEYYGNGTASPYGTQSETALGNLMSPLGVWIAGLNGGTAASAGHVLITKTLYDSYAPWDTLRRNWNCLSYNYANASNVSTYPVEQSCGTNEWLYCIGKWASQYSKVPGSSQLSCNYPLLRYADILLMQAEVENQLTGPDAIAYGAINTVRRRAFKVSLTTPNVVCDLPAGLNQAQFQDSVEAEREKELCFEGVRFWDLRRWGNMYNVMQSLSQYAASTSGSASGHGNGSLVVTVSAAFQTRNNLYPIPTSDLSVNDLLTQNPGW